MKRFKLRTLVAVCLAVALLGGVLTVFSLAQNGMVPTVVYDHAQKGFVFRNVAPYGEGQEHKYANLFPDFTDMMPGDKTEPQEIRVQVENAKNGYVYLYLRTESANEDITEAEQAAFAELMEHATLDVYQGDVLLDSAKLASEGVFLGKFRGDQGTDLDVQLNIDMNYEQQGIRAEIGWVFTAEYHADPAITPVGPNKPAFNVVDHYAYIIGMEDGLVHPELQMSRAEAATIFFRMMLEESREDFWSKVNPYSDVMPDAWYNNAISTLTNAGILNGRPDGSFGPMDNITRAEFAAMAVRFFAEEDKDVDGDAFPDIKDHWANYEINLAHAYNLITGYPDGTFKPDQEISRAEAITIVNRVLNRYPHEEHMLEDMIVWPDNMDKDAWYYEAVQEATNSHRYNLVYDEKQVADYEIWTELLEVRDWAALEREWSEYNSSKNPGEVVSSKTAATFK